MSYNQPHNPRNYFGTRQQGSRMQGGPDESTNYGVPPYDPSTYEREAWQTQERHSEGRPDENYRRDQGGRYGQDFRHNQDYRSSQQEFMDSEYELGGGSREDWEQPHYAQQDDWGRQQRDRQQQWERQPQTRGGYQSAQFAGRQSNFEERPQRWGGESRYASERNQFSPEGYYPPQGTDWHNNAPQRYQAQRNPHYFDADLGGSGTYAGGYTQQDAGYQGWLDRGFRGEHQGFRGTQQSFRGRAPKGYERSDERIKEDLCERLTHDHFVDASEITVTVKTGVVTLEGTIGDRNQKYRAEDLADNISGVKDVQNRLNVARSGQQSAQGMGSGGSSDFGRGTQSSDFSRASTQNVTRQ